MKKEVLVNRQYRVAIFGAQFLDSLMTPCQDKKFKGDDLAGRY
jgi:hypothetical protein